MSEYDRMSLQLGFRLYARRIDAGKDQHQMFLYVVGQYTKRQYPFWLGAILACS